MRRVALAFIVLLSTQTSIRLCAEGVSDADFEFYRTIHDPANRIVDCTVPTCRPIDSGAGYGPHTIDLDGVIFIHEQEQPATGTSGDPWAPLPPPGCL